MAKKIKPTSQHLFETGNQSLHSIIDKIYYLEGVNQALQSILEKPLVEHCRVANIRDNCIVIEAKSSVWATLLRYRLPDLLQKLRKTPGLEGLSSIDYYVARHEQDSKRAHTTNQLNISNRSASLLAETADHVKNPQLRATLLRLSELGEKK